jgi:hypothetical protein
MIHSLGGDIFKSGSFYTIFTKIAKISVYYRKILV